MISKSFYGESDWGVEKQVGILLDQAGSQEEGG